MATESPVLVSQAYFDSLQFAANGGSLNSV
jgi:hypothetical protein